MKHQARICGCFSIAGPADAAAAGCLRDLPREAGWRIVELPRAGFMAAAADATVAEDSAGCAAAAGCPARSAENGRGVGEADGDSVYCAARFDKASGSLSLAVDTFGIERLFYCERNGHLCFADDIAALWSWFGAPKTLCPQSIDAYFTFFQTPAPFTGFRGIRQVPPNGRVVVANGRIDVEENVWKPPAATAIGMETALHALETSLGDSMASQIGASGTAGLLFSGGVDSMLLAAVLRRRGIHVNAHSFGTRHSDELRIAAERARWLDMPQRDWVMPAHLPLAAATRKWRMPVFSPRSLHVDWFCAMAAQESPYLISGSGADGLFGEPHWRSIRGADGERRAPAGYRAAARFARRYLYGKPFRRLVRDIQPENLLPPSYAEGSPFPYLKPAGMRRRFAARYSAGSPANS